MFEFANQTNIESDHDRPDGLWISGFALRSPCGLTSAEAAEIEHCYTTPWDAIYEKVDKAMFEQFNTTIQHDLNAKPTFHKTMIVTQMAKDASIIGFGDLNKNGKVDLDEPKLFKIEMDPDNDRVIVTSASGGQATGRTMGCSGGFFAGVMIGSLLNRQGSAGIKRGHFDSRRVANAPIAARKVASRGGRTGGSRARSGARSGGIRGGK